MKHCLGKLKKRLWVVCAALSCIHVQAWADASDWSVSGFGTLGYAVSDRAYKYQRFVNDQGTVSSDSLFAVQLERKLSQEWSATAQLKHAPSVSSDRDWETTLGWAFVSWRPDNDWLFRLGRFRIPGYLNAENKDVGVTYDYVRPPAEVYSVSQVYNFDGASFNRTIEFEKGDLILDGYWGKTNTHSRGYVRDGIPGGVTPGPFFLPVQIEASGLGLSWRKDEDVYVASFHKAYAKSRDGQPWVEPSLVNAAPGVSYYAGWPDVPSLHRGTMDMSILFLGMDVGVGSNVRLSGEYFRRKLGDLTGGLNNAGGYVSLRRKTGAWTPYAYYAWLRSDDATLDGYSRINGNTVPSSVDGAPLINASQRAWADSYEAYDQSSWAIGTSYALNATSKIKAEWLRTQIGKTSSLINAPYGSNISHEAINVLSLSYSFVF